MNPDLELQMMKALALAVNIYQYKLHSSFSVLNTVPKLLFLVISCLVQGGKAAKKEITRACSPQDSEKKALTMPSKAFQHLVAIKTITISIKQSSTAIGILACTKFSIA